MIDAQPVTFGNRFQAGRLLQEGLGIVTLEGRDRTTGDAVVIKTAPVHSVSSAVRMRLDHAVLALGQADAEYLAPLVQAGVEGDLLYVVAPHVEGTSLRDRLEQGRLSLEEALTVARSLLSALRDVHGRGVLHGDVKPENVIVRGAPIEQAVLVDFGLSRSQRLDPSQHARLLHAARYSSPEGAGLLRQAVDERADLYAAGIVLFECLAGRVPFDGDQVGAVLRQHLSVRPPSLRGEGVPVPAALDALIAQLLRNDPRDRYQTAAAALADLIALADALHRGVAEPQLVLGLRDRRRTLAEPAFVGREPELAALALRQSLAAQGRGGLVLLEGQSGGGKTWLLERLAQQSQDSGAWVLWGQGLADVAQRPLQVLAGVVDALVATVHLEPDAAVALRARVDERRADLCAALPALASVLGPVPASALGVEEYGEARTLDAVVALLDALGTEGRPALVLLDDCQWADEVTLKLLDYWQRRPERQDQEANRYVLVVAAFRSEDVAADHPLRGLAASVQVRLPAFQTEDMQRLVYSMAGSVPQEALATVELLAAGSPFMASAVLRGLVESGALVDAPSGWTIEPMALAEVQSSRRAALFLARRLELLPEPVLRLVTAGAVLGKQFDLDLAAALADQAPSEAIAAIGEARRRHIVWQDERIGRCTFVHDKLREVLLSLLGEEERKQLHRRTAEHIAAADAGKVFDLAYHFDAAGAADQALPYAMTAAEQARGRHDLATAEAHYRIAQRGLAVTDTATRYRVAEGLGEVLMLRSQYDDAAEHLQQARPLAADHLTRLHIDGLLGQIAAKRGDSDTAATYLERALAGLGLPVPRSAAGYLLSLAREVAVQALHIALPRWLRPRRSRTQAETELHAARLYRRLVHAYAYQGMVKLGWALLRNLNLAERYPGTEELAQAYADMVQVASIVGRVGLSQRYAERSLAIRSRYGDIWGMGQTICGYAAALGFAGRFDEALAKYGEGMRLLERAGDRWEINFARWGMAHSLLGTGDLRGAARAGRRVYEDGLQVGDRSIMCLGLAVWAIASGGLVPAGLIQAQLGETQNALERSNLLAAEGVRLLGEDRVHDAVQALDAAVAVFRKAGLPRTNFTLPALQWQVTALRRAVEHNQTFSPAYGRTALRRAQREAAGWRRAARKLPGYFPHALREQAQLLALAGKPEPALQLLDQALAAAERQGMRYEQAQIRRVRGQVRLGLGLAGAVEEIAAATATIRSLEPGPAEAHAPAILSLADRFDTLLDVGRHITTALSQEAIFAAVQAAALQLLRAEHCVLLEIDPGSSSPDLWSERGVPISRALVERAMATGRPAIAGEESDEEGSGQTETARSALCAPISARGTVVALLYAVHAGLSGLFNEEELRLAEFIATLAGAALENAEGVAAVETLSRELERKKGEERFRTLIERASDIIIIRDADGMIQFGSPSLERVLGYAPEELIGTRLEAYVHPEDTAAIAAVHSAWSATGAQELRFQHRDGSWRILEAVSTNLLGDPTIQGIVVNARDISERKRAEELQGALLRQELTHAWEIQRRLLPATLPHWPGRLELAARFRAARETSGDFYDVVGLLPATQVEGEMIPLQIAVGDVAGKGIAASLVMALARTMLRAGAQSAHPVQDLPPLEGGQRTGNDPVPATVPSPASTMRLVTRLLNQDVGRRDFVACALAVVEADDTTPGGARMRLTNAAQVPPLLCRDGQARELVPPGDHLPLGVLSEVGYEEMVITFQPGDVVVFSTDGLAEAPAQGAVRPGELFGFERLAASAARWSARAEDAESVASGIWQDVTAWGGEAPEHDDMTLVVLRVSGATREH